MTLSCRVRALRGEFRIDVQFDSARRVVGIEGASGAGKTTLLHALAGLIPTERARLFVDGQGLVDTEHGLDPAIHQRRIGYVFQDARLFPHLKVADNIAYASRFARRRVDMDPISERLGIGHLLGRWTRNLSGGEARRVAIARALASDPGLILLDEPFSGLDADRRAELIPWLVAITQETDVPILVVSHEAADLCALGADRVKLEAGRISPDRRP